MDFSNTLTSVHVQRRDADAKYDEFGNVILTKEQQMLAEPPRGTVRRIKEFDKKVKEQRLQDDAKKRTDKKAHFMAKTDPSKVWKNMYQC